MPFARNGTVNLHWESFGEGPAVLLVAGQGMTVDGWWATIPVLARSFRVIAFDNRDTGRSSRVPWPYSVAQMASDAVAVLDAAGEQRAHVYGISLGSLVAQEVALRHPDRVQALVLGASSAGGFAAYMPTSFVETFFARAGAMTLEEADWATVAFTYGEKTLHRCTSLSSPSPTGDAPLGISPSPRRRQIPAWRKERSGAGGSVRSPDRPGARR